jgi:hypothetical protein
MVYLFYEYYIGYYPLSEVYMIYKTFRDLAIQLALLIRRL